MPRHFLTHPPKVQPSPVIGELAADAGSPTQEVTTVEEGDRPTQTSEGHHSTPPQHTDEEV